MALRRLAGISIVTSVILGEYLAGALTQEVIDLLAIFNALRAAFRPKELTDFDAGGSALRAGLMSG